MSAKVKLYFFLALSFSSYNCFGVEVGNKSVAVLTQPRSVANSQEWRPHLGVSMGMVNPEGSYGSTAELGLDAGFQVYVPFSIGGELTRSELKPNSGDKTTRTSLLAKLYYNLAGNILIIKNSYLGFVAGTVFTADGTDFAAGPLVGFDIPIGTREKQSAFSVGAMGKYAVVSGGNPDALSVTGVVKYWY